MRTKGSFIVTTKDDFVAEFRTIKDACQEFIQSVTSEQVIGKIRKEYKVIKSRISRFQKTLCEAQESYADKKGFKSMIARWTMSHIEKNMIKQLQNVEYVFVLREAQLKGSVLS